MKQMCKGVAVLAVLAAGAVQAAELWVGAAEVSITPDRPVSLAGQFHQRISKKVESPCMAMILALEAREGDKSVGQAILVALDFVTIPFEIQRDLRARLGARLPGFDTNMLVLAATHTHTGPTPNQERFNDYGEAMQPKEYVPFMLDRLTDTVAKAWEGRKPGAVAWGLGHAVVGHNRRVVYADGSAVMYGKLNTPNFRGLEGWEDHAVDVLCFTDSEKRLIAAALAVPCPSQTVEGLHEVSADYWHHVRERLKAKYGEGLVVLGFCGPAGDQVPRPMLRGAAEARMERLRKLSRKQELGRRIAAAFDDTWEVIRSDLRTDVPFAHRVERFQVPGRKLTDQEYEEAKKGYESYAKRDEKEPGVYSRKRWYKRTLDRYEAQQKSEPVNKLEIHVLRVGDLALATNPFELFVDYAMRIHGRSPAGQTMLVQLASPADVTHSYLPSERAVKGGGYSAVPQSTPVGPEGGQIFVEKTLDAIKALFK
jgi:hypothetical protein